MKLFRHSWFLLMGIFFLLTSCGEIQNIEIRGADNLKYRGFKDNHVQFEADVNVYNPSNHKIKIKEIDVKLLVNDIYLGRLQNTGEIQILPHSEGYMTIPFQLRVINILTGISTISKLYNQKNLKVEVDGFVTAKTVFVKRRVNIKKTTYIDSLK